MFWPEDDADDALVGVFRRLEPRAVSLFAFLATRMDMDTGRVRGGLAEWCRAEHHGRDPRTVRVALGELIGVGLVEWADLEPGDDGRPRRALYAGGAFWDERCRIRGSRNMNKGGRDAWVQHRDTIIRGGPWQALTDTQRTLWLFLRAMAPREARKTPKGEARNANPISQSKIRARTGLSERCITAGLAVLERAGLVEVTRRRRSDLDGRWLVNVYSVPAELRRKVAGRYVDFSKTVPEQIRGRFEGNHRQRDYQLVAWWWGLLRPGADPPVRVRARAAPG